MLKAICITAALLMTVPVSCANAARIYSINVVRPVNVGSGASPFQDNDPVGGFFAIREGAELGGGDLTRDDILGYEFNVGPITWTKDSERSLDTFFSFRVGGLNGTNLDLFVIELGVENDFLLRATPSINNFEVLIDSILQDEDPNTFPKSILDFSAAINFDGLADFPSPPPPPANVAEPAGVGAMLVGLAFLAALRRRYRQGQNQADDAGR